MLSRLAILVDYSRASWFSPHQLGLRERNVWAVDTEGEVGSPRLSSELTLAGGDGGDCLEGTPAEREWQQWELVPKLGLCFSAPKVPSDPVSSVALHGVKGGLRLGAMYTCGPLGKHTKVMPRWPEMTREIWGGAVLPKRAMPEECEHFQEVLGTAQRIYICLVGYNGYWVITRQRRILGYKLHIYGIINQDMVYLSLKEYVELKNTDEWTRSV